MTWAWTRPPPELRPALRAVVMLDPPRLDVGRSSAIDLSPDGTRVVYVASQASQSQLYYSALDAFEATPLAGTGGGENPFYSPSRRLSPMASSTPGTASCAACAT